jgi:hypothetical protein
VTTRFTFLPILSAAVVVALAACSSAGSSSGSPAGASEPSSSAGAVTGSPSSGPPGPSDASGVPPELLAAVRTDAARRMSVDPGSIGLVSATAVTWNDGSLGCPEPGVMYTQALVSGWRIVVHAADRDLDYRVVRPEAVKLCERPGAVGSGDPGSY